jgi:hypothetical protein
VGSDDRARRVACAARRAARRVSMGDDGPTSEQIERNDSDEHEADVADVESERVVHRNEEEGADDAREAGARAPTAEHAWACAHGGEK